MTAIGCLTTNLLCVQIPAVRQQLLELNAMSFLIQQVGLEAELQMTVSEPLSSTTTAAPTTASESHDAAAQPSSCPAGTSGSLHNSQPDAAAGKHKVPISSSQPHSQRASYRSSTSRLRLPALPPGSARSPRISARYPGLDASGGAAKAVEPSWGGLQLPAGFLSAGDLEEDTQQLLEMGSEVQVSLHFLQLCFLSVASRSVVPDCTVCFVQFCFCAASQPIRALVLVSCTYSCQLPCYVASPHLFAASLFASTIASVNHTLCVRQPGS